MVSRGAATREAILDRALERVSAEGLNALSIGSLSLDLGMSKSGLFAHFESKENLELAILREAADRFVEKVIGRALKARRGEPRIRKIFEHWMQWEQLPTHPGGCIFIAVSDELDNRPGPVRELLVSQQRDLLQFLAASARIAVEEGDFRGDVEPEQFAWDLYSIILTFHHFHHLMREPEAGARAQRSFERLVQFSHA